MELPGYLGKKVQETDTVEFEEVTDKKEQDSKEE